MSNDKSTASDDLSLDLEDGDANDSSADTAERSDEVDDTSEDASTNLDLDPEKAKDEDKAKKQEVAKEQHAIAWAKKIKAGETTYDELPKSVQYLLPRIKTLVDGEKEAKEPKVEQKKTSREEVMAIVRFEALKEKVQQANRTSQQNKILNAEFKLLVSKGFDPEEALKRAVKEAELDLEEPAEMPKMKFGSASPAAGKAKYSGNEDPSKMSRQELAAFNSHNRGPR